MEHLSIGEVARRSGLRPSALRYYESIGLLPAAPRVNGRRQYAPDIVNTITLIQFARRTGFTLAETRRLFQPDQRKAPLSGRGRALAYQKLDQLDELIKRATQMKTILAHGLACECQQPDECVILDREWWDRVDRVG